MYYHGTVGEEAEDIVFDREGSLGYGADMAAEELSDTAEKVLADGGEDGGSGKVPEFLELTVELSEEVADAGDWRDII